MTKCWCLGRVALELFWRAVLQAAHRSHGTSRNRRLFHKDLIRILSYHIGQCVHAMHMDNDTPVELCVQARFYRGTKSSVRKRETQRMIRINIRVSEPRSHRSQINGDKYVPCRSLGEQSTRGLDPNRCSDKRMISKVSCNFTREMRSRECRNVEP